MIDPKVTVFVASPNTNPRGVGKTMLMTESVYKDLLNNKRKIIANYHLYLPKEYKEYFTYMPYEEIIKFPDELYNANICLDEIFIGANSRRSFSKENIALLEFLTQIRKRNCDVFITAQTARQIDVGIRDQIDIIVEMKKHIENGEIIPLFFDVIVRDRHIWDPNLNVLNRFIYDGRKLASLNIYDTDEIILKDGSIKGNRYSNESEVDAND